MLYGLELVARRRHGQQPVVLKFESLGRIRHVGAGHQIVLGVDGPQPAGSARGQEIDRLGSYEHNLPPSTIGVTRLQMGHRQIDALAHLQIFQFPFPRQTNCDRAKKLSFGLKAPSDAPFGQILRRGIERRFRDAMRVVMNIGCKLGGNVDAQAFYRAVANVVKKCCFIFHDARINLRHEQLPH